ncbi:GNAT family N-acetyltransferase [Aurantimonas aggregata]|uniref:GNAT family N-acetyltransferase n=1 Tax=Aurantimonas aggregata TaxID=2047720 RepID=A0A6L9MMI4_9HYPH|nr:GNAT family N-acetyltransferase [Aurantimonas aggregata]NDV89033.1 GNAT family N-acetyltransferase [Aurantimonas aggregata]
MSIPSLSRVEGIRLSLRLIQPDDAEYLYELRTNPSYNRHLSEVSGTVEDQRKWIQGYKSKEVSGEQYYFIIERGDGVRCGVVRLYDIGAESFTWGSWILDHEKPSKAALESALLSFGVGFDLLGKRYADVDVRIENTHALAFYRRLGMTETSSDELNIYLVYTRDRFKADRPAHLMALRAEKQ